MGGPRLMRLFGRCSRSASCADSQRLRERQKRLSAKDRRLFKRPHDEQSFGAERLAGPHEHRVQHVCERETERFCVPGEIVGGAYLPALDRLNGFVGRPTVSFNVAGIPSAPYALSSERLADSAPQLLRSHARIVGSFSFIDTQL